MLLPVLLGFAARVHAQVADALVGTVLVTVPDDVDPYLVEDAVRPAIAETLEVEDERVQILETSRPQGQERVQVDYTLEMDAEAAEAAAAKLTLVELAPGFLAHWTQAAAARGVSAEAAVSSSSAHALSHADGRGCGLTTDSDLCQLVTSSNTTVEDIVSRKHGHAQFECMHTLLEAGEHAKLIAYAWCVLPHCPSATRCWFPRWGRAECESEVHNFLGFAYRADESEPGKAEEYVEKGYAHYHASLELNAENCGTWGYLGQLYALQTDQVGARKTLDALCTLNRRDARACPDTAVELLRNYTTKAGLETTCTSDADLPALVRSLPLPEADVSEDPFHPVEQEGSDLVAQEESDLGPTDLTDSQAGVVLGLALLWPLV